MLLDKLSIIPITDPAVLTQLATEATSDGHRMVRRLIEEWIAGENRFDKPGEQSYVAMFDDQVCGACGLNIDPFANDSRIARVRRLYVATSHRRSGIGSAIMQKLMQYAAGQFDELQLRTHDPQASAFYEAIGFVRVADSTHCTHKRSIVG